MATLDRLKLRIETDLADSELTAIIDGIEAEIDARFGSIAEFTVQTDGHRRWINMAHPVSVISAIVEISPSNTGAAGNQTTLASDDYRITDGGRTIERLSDGTNGQSAWSALVEVTYTPVGNQPQRDEATIKLAMMDMTFQGLTKTSKIGDYSSGGSADPNAWQIEREAIFQTLIPRGRMGMA